MSLRSTFPHTLCKLALLLLACSVLLTVSALDFPRLQSTLRAMGGNQQLLLEWRNLIQTNMALTTSAKLEKVNDFFNQKITYTEDQEVWGVEDYWATPMELLSKEKGDCEDYVIAKYFTLLNMNVPENQLRLIYVKAKITNADGTSAQQAHMILAYYPSSSAEPLILDSLVNDIRPASRRPDLIPIFSFNSQGIYSGVAGNTKPGAGGTSRLSRWQDLLERAKREGF
ncbi:putative transglutaminase-like cysteine proteinase [Undibacterium sp. GrIS 1.8]|uniref:transglutaminase-like cysteine peptidase n=1 Tax=Undibacterium sp. GrIS 1.8 TaxID=3143934 RepID=UPI00339848E5